MPNVSIVQFFQLYRGIIVSQILMAIIYTKCSFLHKFTVLNILNGDNQSRKVFSRMEFSNKVNCGDKQQILLNVQKWQRKPQRPDGPSSCPLQRTPAIRYTKCHYIQSDRNGCLKDQYLQCQGPNSVLCIICIRLSGRSIK